MSNWINLLGLVFEIIGVVVLFYYAGSVGKDASITVSGSPENMHRQVDEYAQKIKIAKWGLSFIIAGSLCQGIHVLTVLINNG